MQWSIWDPRFLHVKQHLGALHHLVDVELREAQLAVACVHALKVLINAESKSGRRIVVLEEGLGALEALYTVVQRGIRGVHLKIFNRGNARRLPTSVGLVVVTVQHVVSQHGAEDVLVISIRLRLELFSSLNLEVLGLNNNSSKIIHNQNTQSVHLRRTSEYQSESGSWRTASDLRSSLPSSC